MLSLTDGHLAVLTLSLLAAACSGEEPPGPSPPFPAPGEPLHLRDAEPQERKDLERLVLRFSNQARDREGASPLLHDPSLARVARRHSEDMLRRHYFQHDTPEGTTPSERIHHQHRTLFGTTGENLWSGYGYLFGDLPALAREIVGHWMTSPGHRENLLRPEFTHLGVGVATAPGGHIRVTQNFTAAHAYLLRPWPERLAPDAPIQLAIQDLQLIGESGVVPCRVAFQPTSRGEDTSQPLGVVRTPITRGRYQLQLYFPTGKPRSFLLSPGPVVEIR